MKLIAATSIVFVLTVAFAVSGFSLPTQAEHQAANVSGHSGEHAARDGQAIFRFDTFGDEQLWTDVLRMHEALDPGYAARTATGKYRTTPLRGVIHHAPYFHDGSAANLLVVVNHYDEHFRLNLTAAQKADLVEYLKSL